jgi:plastocyanin
MLRLERLQRCRQKSAAVHTPLNLIELVFRKNGFRAIGPEVLVRKVQDDKLQFGPSEHQVAAGNRRERIAYVHSGRHDRVFST